MPTFQLIFTQFLLCCFGIFPSMGLAQTIPSTNINTAFAPVTVVPDHPACNQAGDTAFSIAMRADDLHFRLKGQNWDGFVDVEPTGTTLSAAECTSLERRGTDVYENNCAQTNSFQLQTGSSVVAQKQCTIRERKGTQIIARQIPCGLSEPSRNLADIVPAEGMQVKAEAKVTICQSLTSYRILDGQYAASVTLGNETATYDGDLILPGAATCREAGAPDTLRAGVSYMPSQTPTNVEMTVAWSNPTFVRLWIDNLVVALPGTEESPVTLETAAAFFPTVQGDAVCSGGTCLIDNRQSFRIGSQSWSACR